MPGTPISVNFEAVSSADVSSFASFVDRDNLSILLNHTSAAGLALPARL